MYLYMDVIILDEKRKKIILDEVQYWKKTKLLPEQYCDYLIALYSHGEMTSNVQVEKHHHEKDKLPYLFFILIPLYFVILLASHIKAEYILLFGLILTGIFIYMILRQPIRVMANPILLMINAVLMVSVTVEIWDIWIHNRWALFAILCLHCLLWLWVGKRNSLLYLKCAGTIGILVLIIYISINV